MPINTRSISYTLPDGAATFICPPGTAIPTVAYDTLFAATRTITGDTVFVAGPGMVTAALWAARCGARVIGWTDNIAEAEAITITFARHRLPVELAIEAWPGMPDPATVAVCADVAHLPPATCDLALIHLPRGKQVQEHLLRLAAAMLHPGGRLAFAGAKNEGIKSALKIAQRIFGRAGIVVRKGGYHAGLAARPEGDFALPEVTFTEHTLTVDGAPTRLINCAGAFAIGRLDDGAAALIAGMQVTPGTRVLDMGCGTGLVGLTALRRGANVTLSDVSAYAIASTRRTLAANGYPNAPVHLVSGAGDLPSHTFDTVITNPPFHKSHGVDFEISQLFVEEAAHVLKAGGKVYLVANAFLPYEPWLKANFSQVSIAYENPRFRVWEGKK